jgi:hypothetical protein
MQNPFAIQKTGFVGVPVFWSGAVTLPDGVTPRDISRWTFRLRVKSSYSDPDSAALWAPPDWTIGAGLGTSGLWTAPEMPSTVTVNIKSGSVVVWDIKALIHPATEPTEFLAGTIAFANTAGTDLFHG